MSLRNRIQAAWRVLTKGPAGEAVLGGAIQSYQAGRGLAYSNDPAEQIKHNVHWVYAAVRAIRDKVAQADMTLEARRGRDWEPVEDHPWLDVLRAVNPYHTRYELLAGTAEFLELTGNAYWYLVRDGLGVPREIWPLSPARMKVVPDPRQFVSGYEYALGATKTIRFTTDEIVHFRHPNPASPFYGWSPLQAAAGAVDAHEAMLRAQNAAFANGPVIPRIFFTTDARINDESVLNRIQQRLEEKFSGPNNAQRIAVAHTGLKPERLALSPQEMDFLQSARATRDVILGIYGVPPLMIGLSEDVNRSSGDAMERVFARNVIAPKLTMMAEVIEQEVFRFYANPERLRLRYKPVLPEDRAEDRANWLGVFDRGGVTRDELRVALTGRQPIGDATRMEPLNYQEVGAAQDTGAATE